MYSNIYKNSFIVAIIVFILLCIIFYVFNFGYEYKYTNGVIEKKFSIKYPLVIALLVWVLWFFVIFPPPKSKQEGIKHSEPNIIMDNWI